VIGTGRLSLNQATVRNLTAAEAAELCVRHQIPGIGLWRDAVAELGLAKTAATVRAAGLHVSSLCRGGFFTHADQLARAASAADNRTAVLEAAQLGADALILVSGGLVPGSRDLALARRMIADEIADLVPFAQSAGVLLGIEPLHPMFCADRLWCIFGRWVFARSVRRAGLGSAASWWSTNCPASRSCPQRSRQGRPLPGTITSALAARRLRASAHCAPGNAATRPGAVLVAAVRKIITIPRARPDSPDPARSQGARPRSGGEGPARPRARHRARHRSSRSGAEPTRRRPARQSSDDDGR